MEIELEGNTLSFDDLLDQLASIKENAESFIDDKDPEYTIWHEDVEACETASAIICALRDEGIGAPEEVHDLIRGYKALVKYYKKMHQKYEVANKPRIFGHMYICPECYKRIYPKNNYCHNCGKPIDWR